MENRRLMGLAGTALASMLALGGCAAAPAPSGTAGTPVAASRAPTQPVNAAQAPCTERLRPGAGGATPMAMTPEVRAEIDRLRSLTPEQQAAEAQASQARDPQLASRLADVRARVERATRPCADR